MKPQLRVKRVGNVNLPRYQTPGSAGFDLEANILTSKCIENSDFHTVIKPKTDNTPEMSVFSIIINPGGRALIGTGLRFITPEGYELQVRPRSGLALKHGVTVVNSPGTVDSDYRQEVGVILINHGQSAFHVRQGDRIAQAVLKPVQQAELVEVDEVEDDTGRGGFGSTGI
jgi:dUTP pyrophosphatase